jgi:hypothetical protein
MDSRGWIPSRSKIFLYSTQTGSEVYPASYPLGYRGLSRGAKRPGREADHSSPSSAEVKNSGAIPSLPHMSSLFNYLSTGATCLFSFNNYKHIRVASLYCRAYVATNIRRVLDWQLDLLDHTVTHNYSVYTLHYSSLQHLPSLLTVPSLAACLPIPDSARTPRLTDARPEYSLFCILKTLSATH